MITRGISQSQAEALLREHGFNELPAAKPKRIGQIALEVIREPMFLLLLGCASVYFLLGDFSEGIILLSWVLVIIGITFYQHRKTERSLEALRHLSSPRALVIRDGVPTRIAGREVVPGDVVILNEGDRVPADAAVLESNFLTVDEALLTGESVPVVKSTEKGSECVFSGTLVVQGSGVVKVTGTGMQTQFGAIGKSLQTTVDDTTRLQREMKVLIRNLFIGGMAISIVVIAAFYFTRGSFLNAVLNGLAAAMALLPEEFPVVLTIFLALGAWRLSKSNVLTRKPSAIETLGSATVLCSDKTGTITQNKMAISALYCDGALHRRSAGPFSGEKVQHMLNALHMASRADSIDPMEKAIAEEHARIAPQSPELKMLREYPLSKKLFAMTRVYEGKENEASMAYCKGAPEAVFGLCRLSSGEVEAYGRTVNEMAGEGWRVLACASGPLTGDALPETQDGFSLQLLGFVAFADPIRPEVPQAIRECAEAGIRVIMITGDYPATAMSIAKEIGLQQGNEVITGTEMQSMTEAELNERVKHAGVFARIVPEQKLQIIRALRANGEVVAMTGDGVNDAPALRTADIGVAMGLKGTDVAREASSLVLLDDDFASIVKAIRLGRRIFDNLQKAMSYIIAIHIPIIGLVMLPTLFAALPILLMPIHIVFMELIIDPVCSVAFESEQEEKAIMQRPPRKPDELFFGFHKIVFSIVKGLLLLVGVIAVYFLSIREGHTEEQVRAIAFSSLIIGNVFLILTSLSDSRNVFAVLRERNKAVLLITVTALVILLLTLTVPSFQRVFGFEFPGFSHFIPAVGAALVVLLILEGVKRWRN